MKWTCYLCPFNTFSGFSSLLILKPCIITTFRIILGEYLWVVCHVSFWQKICIFIWKDTFTCHNDPGWQLLLSQHSDIVIFLFSDIHCDSREVCCQIVTFLRQNFSLAFSKIYVLFLVFFIITMMSNSFLISCLYFFWVFQFLKSFIISFIGHLSVL